MEQSHAVSGTNIPNNPNNPTFYIVVTETESQKRRSPQTSQYLTSDGGLTTNTSEAVQVYESSGQLFTFNGAPSGTYYVNVNVESITFAPQLQSSITSTSISGYFSLSSTLEWEHKLFPNSKALFALSPEGLVKAIFNGKLPPGVKRIGLRLRRVENPPPVSNPTGGSSDVGKTVQSHPLQSTETR